MHRALRTAFAVLLALGVSARHSAARAENPPEVTTAGSAKTLRFISDFKSPPFYYREGMRRVGIEVDIAEALGRQMGREIEWVPMNFSASAYASALEMGKADAAIACISITDARRKSLSFTKPYARMGLALAVKSTVDWRRHWFTNGLKHWKICVVRGTTAERWARENLLGKVQTYSSLDRMVQVLKNSPLPEEKRGGTCILYDEVPLRWALSNYSYHYQVVESRISRERYGIAVKKGNIALLESLNEAIGRLDKSGEGRRLREKWIDKAQGLDFFEDYGE